MRTLIVTAAFLAAACGPEPAPDAGAGAEAPVAADTPENSFRDGRIWGLDMQGATARLTYGTPQTDDVVILMRCEIGSGDIIASFTRGNAEPTDNWPFTLSAGGVSETYQGRATSIELGENAVSVSAEIPANAVALQALRNAQALTLEEQGRSVEMPVQPEQRGDLDRFFTACAER